VKKWAVRGPFSAAVLCFIVALAGAYVVSRLLGIRQEDALLISTALATAMAGVAGVSVPKREHRHAEPPGASGAGSALQELADGLPAIIRRENQALDRLLTRSGRLPVAWTLIAPGTPAAEPGGPSLASRDADWPGRLAGLFRGLEQKQLVVLGEPGSGKTVMAVSLLLTLMPTSGRPGPVPVRFSMGSWNPQVERLHGWMWRMLLQDYPELKSLFSRSDVAAHQDVITREWVIPILDGFDEIPDRDLRNAAVMAVRQELGTDLPMIITSRTEEFSMVARGLNCLPGATIVRMRPLQPDQTLNHLAATAPPEQRPLWDHVLSTAHQDEAKLTSALTSPLMVWLAGVALDSGQIQAEDLLKGESRSDQGSLTERLLASLVLGAFTVALRPPLRDDKLTIQSDPREAERWLAFLARRLLERGQTEIAWWRLQALAPWRMLGLGVASVAGLLVGLVAGRSALLAIEADIAALFGVLLGFGFGHAYSLARLNGVARQGRTGFGSRNSGFDTDFYVYSRKLLFGLAVTLVFAAASAAVTLLWSEVSGPDHAIVTGNGYARLLVYVFAGALLALVLGLAGGTAAGILLRSSNTFDVHLAGARAASPTSAVRKDKGAAIGMLAIGTIVCGSLTFAVLWLTTDHSYWSAAVGAIAGGITASLIFTYWPVFRAATIWFTIRDQLPLSIMSFLEEAHIIGVLRQAGIIYEFRHELLQKSLSTAAIL
jgi:hypothetical protein